MPQKAKVILVALSLAVATPLAWGADTAPTSAPATLPTTTTTTNTTTTTSTAPAPTIALFNERLPIPSEVQIAAAAKVVKDTYSAMYAKPQPLEKLTLARKLLSDGKEAKLDAPSRYFLLREAADLAGSVGDLNIATEAVDVMNFHFAIDYRKVKAQTLESVARIVIAQPHFAAGVARQFLQLAQNSLAEDNFADVERLALRAASIAREQRDPQLVRRAEQLLAAARLGMTDPDRLATARETLAKNPDDQLANLLVGRYYSFVKRDFEQGIPMLAKGFDAELKAPAALEVKAKGDAEKLIAAADMWWELAGKLQKTDAQQGAIRQHLQELYINAAPNLTGLTKAVAERRAFDVEAEGDADESLTIVHAAYGASANKGADVTNIVANMFKRDGTAIVHVTPDLLGDPSRGNFKKLFITYHYHGKDRQWDIPEGFASRLPRIPAEGIPAGGQEFRIVEAVFGYDQTWIDVTAKVRLFFKTPATQFRPDIKTLGVDPAPEKNKAFIVIYERGGKRYIKECRNGDVISLDK